MGQKDISEKVLVDYNDVFADILNVCIYNGKEIVKPEELTPAERQTALTNMIKLGLETEDVNHLDFK